MSPEEYFWIYDVSRPDRKEVDERKGWNDSEIRDMLLGKKDED